jgi:hypothetical protein
MHVRLRVAPHSSSHTCSSVRGEEMSSRFQEGRWRDWYEVNAIELSTFCLARGRYEVARELHAIGTDWYEREVVNKSNPGDTAAEREHYCQVLGEYKERLADFPLLVATRTRFLESLNANAGGIDRDKFKSTVVHEGSTAFGVICNQLARGGWLRQEKTGKKYTLYPAGTPPPSDDVFVRKEMPTPEELDAQAASARPIATLNADLPLEKRSGCLPKFFGLVTVVLTLIWGCL